MEPTLIDRLDKATEPDTMLDDLIAAAVMAARDDRIAHADFIPRSPRYTASLDAALSLIPNGVCLEELKQFTALSVDGKPLWSCLLSDLRHSVYDAKRKRDSIRSVMRPTPALAVCGAAIRAIDRERLTPQLGEVVHPRTGSPL